MLAGAWIAGKLIEAPRVLIVRSVPAANRRVGEEKVIALPPVENVVNDPAFRSIDEAVYV